MNKNKPIKASVIICAYNEEHTISQSLTSLIEQSFQKDSYEILIIDDESTDKTSEIVKEIIENNSKVNIKYIKIKHAGLSVARNTGIKATNHDYIGFMDGDAKADSNWIENMLNKFNDSDISIVGGNVENLNLYGSKFSDFIHKLHFKASLMIGKSKVTGTNMFFRKEVFSNGNLFLDTFTARGDERYVVANYFKKNMKKKESYAFDATVFNEHPTTLKQWLNQQFTEGRCGLRIDRILHRFNMKKVIDTVFRFFFVSFLLLLIPFLIFNMSPMILIFSSSPFLFRLLYRYKYFLYGISNVKHYGIIHMFIGFFILTLGTIVSDIGNIYETFFGPRKELKKISNTEILETFDSFS